MKAQHTGSEYEGLEWRVMDVRNMELEDGVFGVAIDKVRVVPGRRSIHEMQSRETEKA
jgi:hypothetical protein